MWIIGSLSHVCAQETILDNVLYNEDFNYQYLRERIDSAENKSKFTRFIFNTFTNSSYNKNIDINSQARPSFFSLYKGLVIDSIVIDQQMPFSVSKENKKLDKILRLGANSLHVLTREKIITKNLLFKEGDVIDPVLLEQTENLLQESENFSNVYITIERLSEGGVCVYVHLTDRLTLSVGVDYRGRNSNSKAFIGEDNFLGRGNRLRVYDYYNLDKRDFFKGAEILHEFTNLWGSFFNLQTNVGLGKDFYIYNAEMNKRFIKTKDYAVGLRYMRDKNHYVPAFSDTAQFIRSRDFNIWGGKSFAISDNGLGFYLTGRFSARKFQTTPYKTNYFNSYYHNNNDLVFALGFYKERYYQGNLIYGFGNRENIPYGFKVEMVSGYRDGEYHRYPYIGAGFRVAHRSMFGYYNIGFKTGAFLPTREQGQQIINTFDISYFSDLVQLKHNYSFRFFFNGQYAAGENMLQGRGQRLDFSDAYRIRGTRIDAIGTTRLFVSPEAVLFTPLHVLGFRFAFYAFYDFGTLGYHVNPFKNQSYNSVGIGARIRNESLVFRTIEFRLAYVPNIKDNMRLSQIALTTQRRFKSQRLIPEEPYFNSF